MSISQGSTTQHSGDGAWRSRSPSSATSAHYEFNIENIRSDGVMIMNQQISNGARCNDSTLLPDDACSLGGTLVFGTDKCR